MNKIFWQKAAQKLLQIFLISSVSCLMILILILCCCGSRDTGTVKVINNLQYEDSVLNIGKINGGYGKSYSGNSQVTNSNQQGTISKVTFFIENSGSMKGYTTGGAEYVDVLTNIANHPDLISNSFIRSYYFYSGISSIVKISNLRTNLVPANFGQPRSDLNQLFKTSLDSSKRNSITILISDGIYDMCPNPNPLSSLQILGHELRTIFIRKLQNSDFQTILVKLQSRFNGRYYPGNCCSAYNINQQRPYYIWIFGKTEILKKYFPDEYLKYLNGYENSARYFKYNSSQISFKPNSYKKIGNFYPSRSDNYTLEKVKTNSSNVLQFSIAVDFSKLPLNDNYLKNRNNYECSNGFEIVSIEPPTEVTKLGLPNQTHLIVVKKTGNPIGQLSISLLNKGYDWISATNLNNDCNIMNNTTQTFGFEVLNKGIIEAYQNFNSGNEIVKFNINLKN